MTLYALIIAGGTGSRLWPRSRAGMPKQFLPLLSEHTMLQETANRIAPLVDPGAILVATGREYVELARAQLPDVPPQNIIGEPSGRGTAPCIGLGAIEIRRRDPDATIAVLSADHMIRKADLFREALVAAAEVARQGYLVTLGITPDRPHTGYGYIRRGASLGRYNGFEAFDVARFVEKPDRATAEAYLAEGGYSWNAGIFVWRVDAIMAALRTCLPELSARLDAIAAAGGPGLPQAFEGVWEGIESVTIDYGVLERAGRVAVIPVDIGWSDVGDWNTVAELAGSNGGGNVVQAEHIGLDTHGTLVYSDSQRLIVTLGLENFVVVDTGDALMIAPRDRAQDVKKIVEELRSRDRTDLL